TLLMEERATIARELHDSLAQVLSYLRIQLTL
ncbi:nitrate/nitrite sensor protein NarQ, partial [Salmonella enterica subsp. enterica serovar Enteritidis str. 543463 40-18]